MGRRERPAQRPRRPGRHRRGAASAGRARRGACLVPRSRPARRRPAAARSRRSGTRRRSTRSGRAPRASRSRRATSSTSPSAMWDAWKASARASASARDAAISYAAYRVLALGRLLRLEPEPHVRAPDERAARALLLARLHRHERTIAGGARKPDRRGRDRRRPARRLERVAALRRPDLHVAEPAADRPRGRFHRARTRPSGSRWRSAAIQPHSLAAVPADVQSFVGAEWGHVRGFALPPSRRGLPIDPGASPLRIRRAPCTSAPRWPSCARPRERSRAAGVVAADLELARRPPGDGGSRQGRPALPRPRRRAQRRRGRGLGSEARLPGAAADLDDPLSRVPGPVERPQAGALQRRRAAARPRPRRAPQRQGRGALAGPLGRRRRLVTAGRHAAVARRRRGGKRVRVRGGRGPERADRALVREPDPRGDARRRSPTGSTSRRT